MSFINKEYTGNLIDGWALSLPFGDGACHGILSLAREVSRDAEARLRTAGAEDAIKHLLVAVGRLDEELRLMLGIGASLEMLERLGPLASVDG